MSEVENRSSAEELAEYCEMCGEVILTEVEKRVSICEECMNDQAPKPRSTSKLKRKPQPLSYNREQDTEPSFECTVCGRIGRVGRCCGIATRRPLNTSAEAEVERETIKPKTMTLVLHTDSGSGYDYRMFPQKRTNNHFQNYGRGR